MTAGAAVVKPRAPSRPLVIGVIITSLTAVLTGLGFVSLGRASRSMVPQLLAPIGSLGVGLAAGFLARWSLPNHSRWRRWWVALFAVCCGLIALGSMGSNSLGLDLLNPRRVRPDWIGLAQLAAGMMTASLAVFAWSSQPAAKPAPRPRRRTAAIAARSRRRPIDLKPSVVPAIRSLGRRRTDTQPLLRLPERGLKIGGRSRAQTQHRVRSAHAGIHINTQEQHRCPYCLEPVDPQDPGGVRVCSICHTMHHADCWEVTGTCQVPHYHE
jgi:ribosomal protein L37AE/L43A